MYFEINIGNNALVQFPNNKFRTVKEWCKAELWIEHWNLKSNFVTNWQISKRNLKLGNKLPNRAVGQKNVRRFPVVRQFNYSSIRPPYVNGVVYLNDEAGHPSIRPPLPPSPMFNHSKTLKLCYITVWNLFLQNQFIFLAVQWFFGDEKAAIVDWNSKADSKAYSKFDNSIIYSNERVKLAKCIWRSVFWFGDLLHCIYLWSLETPIVSASTQLGVSQQTLVDSKTKFVNKMIEVYI